jgi:hypothetical protein
LKRRKIRDDSIVVSSCRALSPDGTRSADGVSVLSAGREEAGQPHGAPAQTPAFVEDGPRRVVDKAERGGVGGGQRRILGVCGGERDRAGLPRRAFGENCVSDAATNASASLQIDSSTASTASARTETTGVGAARQPDPLALAQPDGSARRQIAGAGARAAVTDVAVLDRFEILSEPTASSDLTGTAGLLVYDIATGRTVTVSPAASGVYTHDGVLWWPTGQVDLAWHTLDLRTA